MLVKGVNLKEKALKYREQLNVELFHYFYLFNS